MYPGSYFITWSCYGARLHGDERGTVDRWHNAFDSPKLVPSEPRQQWDRRQMTEDPFVMSADARSTVDSTIRRHAEIRGWTIRALNVRTNHVHVVVSAVIDPETVMGQFKAWSSRKLREAGSSADGPRCGRLTGARDTSGTRAALSRQSSTSTTRKTKC